MLLLCHTDGYRFGEILLLLPDIRLTAMELRDYYRGLGLKGVIPTDTLVYELLELSA